MLWPLLDPRRGWVAFTFLSHKVFRWICPFFLVGMLVSNLLLVGRSFYQNSLFCQLTFYLVSLVGAFVPGQSKALKPVRLATMFTSMNVALLFGSWRWLRGSQKGAWRRTARVQEGGGGPVSDPSPKGRGLRPQGFEPC